VTEPIGRRIALHRRRRGLSQAAVAGLVGRSESWLSQVERGLRGVDSHSVLRELARVLRVEVDALTGAEAVGDRTASSDRQLTAIERALLLRGANDQSLDPPGAVPELHRAYQAARYDDVLAELPALILGLDGQESSQVAAGYTVVAKTLTKIGAFELALIAADRAWDAARHGGDRADVGMAAYQVVAALLPTSRAALAEELAVTVASDLESDADPAVSSVAGALWLIAAVAAARRIDDAGARERLDRAQQLADRLGEDANHWWTAFGPTNVAIHRVSVAVELGDAPAALVAAADVDLDRLPDGLRSRRVQVQLDIAWAHAQRRRDAEALVSLLEVERAAPQVTRRNVVARDTIRQLLARARGTTGSAVRGLAERARVAV
jgi:transcriptional regulator with XRE-family HTH domain